MALLHVHLLDGFAGDDVRVAADGQEVAHGHDVTTRLLEGHAATLDADVPAGAATVEVNVPRLGATAQVPLPAAAETHVFATLENGGLRMWTSDRSPFFG